jgi:cytoskeletal protein RodZ
MERKVETVSDVLKAAREEQRLTIKAIAEEICVQSTYLKAIEAGDYDQLPAQTFAVGFVRSYAVALGLDANEIVLRFKQETGIDTHTQKIEVKPEHVREQRRVPTWLSPIAGLIGASFCWMAWGGSFTATTLVSEVDGVAVEEAQLAALAVDLVDVAEDDQTPAGTVSDLVVSEIQPKSRSFFIPAAHADAPDTREFGAVLIKAEEDSWISVSRKDGSEVWTGVLEAGQEYAPENIGELLLTTSNAGGLYVAGKVSGFEKLGKRGEIIIDAEVATAAAMAVQDASAGPSVGSR